MVRLSPPLVIAAELIKTCGGTSCSNVLPSALYFLHTKTSRRCMFFWWVLLLDSTKIARRSRHIARPTNLSIGLCPSPRYPTKIRDFSCCAERRSKFLRNIISLVVSPASGPNFADRQHRVGYGHHYKNAHRLRSLSLPYTTSSAFIATLSDTSFIDQGRHLLLVNYAAPAEP